MNISVCLALYNGEQYLNIQLDSIINQLTSQDELLISDDGSLDKSLTIADQYKQKNPQLKITIFKNNFKNINLNFNFLLTKASNEIIFLADQDDIWLSERANIIKKKFQENPQTLAILNDCEIFNQNEIIHKSFFSLRKAKKGIIKNIYKNSYIGCCLIIRKELLTFALPIPKNAPMHDQWLGIIAEIQGKVLFLNQPLLKYRRHQNNISSSINQSRNSISTKIKQRIVLLYLLIQRFLRNKLNKPNTI